MLLNARQIAYMGLLLAICEVLLYMSAVLSINTLALLFLAAVLCRSGLYLSSAGKGGVFFLASLSWDSFDSQPVILVDIYRVRHLYFGLGRITAPDADEISGVECVGGEAGIL